MCVRACVAVCVLIIRSPGREEACLYREYEYVHLLKRWERFCCTGGGRCMRGALCESAVCVCVRVCAETLGRVFAPCTKRGISCRGTAWNGIFYSWSNRNARRRDIFPAGIWRSDESRTCGSLSSSESKVGPLISVLIKFLSCSDKGDIETLTVTLTQWWFFG